MMREQKKPRSAARQGFSIVNPYGDMWTTEIFGTAEQAHEYVRQFWKGKPFDYRVVRARLRTSYLGEVSDAG